MKALILAGGKGSRLRPITYSIAKQLVPVANKPVIEFGIEAIREAGVRDFGIIVGDSESEIREALGDGSKWDARFAYIRQSEPLGLAHAVKTAQPYLGGSKFIMYLGDNLIKSGVPELVREFETGGFDSSILLTRVPNPQDFGVAVLQGDKVVSLEEKPKNPKSDYALVGVYLFNETIFEAIDTLKPSARGEFEITDAIQALIDMGKDVRSHIVTGWWKDTGTVEAMLEANRLILEDLPHSLDGELLDSTVIGGVTLAKGARLNRSRVEGPAIIGPGCEIVDSNIGPFTSIAAGTRIVGSNISNSIVMDGCVIENLTHPLIDSLVGRGVVVRNERADAGMSLVLGDHSSISIP